MYRYPPSYPYQYSSPRVPRRYVQTVDLDDYTQLQLLLQQERERRQAMIAEQERRRAAEAERLRKEQERRAIEEALQRLYYVQQARQQYHLEEERRRRREQRYRAALSAALREAQEEEYRRNVMAAMERQKRWEAARLAREENLRKQRLEAQREEERKVILEGLLKHVMGQSVEEEEADSDEEKVPQLNDDDMVWKKYYRPSPNVPTASQKPRVSFAPETDRQGRRPEIKEHVAPLQSLLDSLLSDFPSVEQRNQQESDARHKAFDDILKDTASSAEARHHHHHHPHRHEEKEKKADERAFESFLNQILPEQQATLNPQPEPPMPQLSEDEAASKIQGWYKSAHDSHTLTQVTHQLSTLTDLATKLDNIEREFKSKVGPLTFTDPSTNTDITATSQGNRHWLHYEDEIMNILVKLDTIDSFGSDIVRERRKELVKKATFILDSLDEHKQNELERASSSSSTSAEAAESAKPQPYNISEAEETVQATEESKEEPKTEEPTKEEETKSEEPKAEEPKTTEEPKTDDVEPMVVETEAAATEEVVDSSEPMVVETEALVEDEVKASQPMVVESEPQQADQSKTDSDSNQPMAVDSEPPKKEEAEPSTSTPIPGHPHPENPNATTVDDAPEGEDGFVVL